MTHASRAAIHASRAAHPSVNATACPTSALQVLQRGVYTAEIGGGAAENDAPKRGAAQPRFMPAGRSLCNAYYTRVCMINSPIRARAPPPGSWGWGRHACTSYSWNIIDLVLVILRHCPVDPRDWREQRSLCNTYYTRLRMINPRI